jgi:DNA replication protein DnaC
MHTWYGCLGAPQDRRPCAKEHAGYGEFLLRLSEAELLERERKGTERRIKTARFPARKSLDDFDFLAAPSENKTQILEQTRCEWIDKPECYVLLGNHDASAECAISGFCVL